MARTKGGARSGSPGIVRAHYEQSVAGCLSAAIGADGLSPPSHDAWISKLGPALSDLQTTIRARRLGPLSIVDDYEDIAEAEAALTKLIKGAGTLIYFGTGGSSLGGQTLAQLAGWSIPGDAGAERKQRPRVRFYDNLDPRTLQRGLANVELKNCRFIVTSKSGGTAETLSQMIAALEALKKAGLEDKIPKLFLGISEPAVPGRANGLRTLCESLGIPMLPHHTGIGGRFSVLSNVGLLPAMALGLDARAIRRGARDVIDGILAAKRPQDVPSAVGAATAVALSKEKGVSTLVMMPYSDRLQRLGHWYVQLWAESLGKSGEGTTPVAALGPVDQHSQLQLYMDGPHQHLVTFIRLAKPEPGPRITAKLARMVGLDYLAGRSVGDLVDAQSRAVPEALIGAKRPVRTFDLERLDEATLGALLMHFMVETIFAADLLKIDPFDQPAVEVGKRLAKQRLLAKVG